MFIKVKLTQMDLLSLNFIKVQLQQQMNYGNILNIEIMKKILLIKCMKN